MAEPREPGPPPPESARERLLAAALAIAMQGGIADLSLRELAAAIGTSHRMLLYHFGSREGLLAAVTLAVEEAERTALRQTGAISADDARRFWARYSDPALWPQERLFFELYAHALRGRPGTEGFLEHVVTGWLEPLTAAIVQDGVDKTFLVVLRHGHRRRAEVLFGELQDLFPHACLVARVDLIRVLLDQACVYLNLRRCEGRRELPADWSRCCALRQRGGLGSGNRR